MNKQQRKSLENYKNALSDIGEQLAAMVVGKITDEVLDVLKDIAGDIEDVRGAVEEQKNDEQDKYDNMPEGLQGSERGCAMTDAIGELESAESDLSNTITALGDIALDTTAEDYKNALDEAAENLSNAADYIANAVDA